jgi:hypothetical protein
MKLSKKRNPLSIKHASKEYQELLKELLPLKITKNPFYGIWSNQWPLEALAEEIRKHFIDADFKKIYEIHSLRESEILSKHLSSWKTIGVIFAGCTIVLQIVPKELIDKIKFFDYGTFKIVTFLITLALVIYLLILMLPIRIKENKEKREFHEVGYILKYIAITETNFKFNKAIHSFQDQQDGLKI